MGLLGAAQQQRRHGGGGGGGGTPTAWSSRISASSDDANERQLAEYSGSFPVDTSEGFLYLGRERTTRRTVDLALRYLAVPVPQGATVQSATVQFTAEASVQFAGFALDIVGIAEDDTATFQSPTPRFSTRGYTAASVVWTDIPDWTRGEAGAGQRTPDIAAVVQEIVDRPGWSAGNALAIVLQGRPTPDGRLDAYAFDDNPALSPLLAITYLA